MKKVKKYLSILLSFALIFASLSQGNIVKAADNPTVYADAVTTEPGEEISIPVTISGNAGIMGFMMSVTYDEEILTPTAVTIGELLSGNFDHNMAESEAGEYDILWSGTEDAIGDGVLYTLTFTVADTAQAGTTEIGLSYSQADTFNEAWEDVVLDCQAVSVSIAGEAEVSGEPSASPTNEPTISPASGSTESPTSEPPASPTNEPSASPFSGTEEPQTTPDVTLAPDDAEFRVYGNEVNAEAGKEISIPVYLSNNQGIMGFVMSVSYDTDILTPVSVEAGALIPSGTTFDNNADISTSNTFDILWAGTDNVTEDGCLYNLNFKVADDAEAGNTNIQLSYSQSDTFNVDYEDVVLNCIDITVSIGEDGSDASPSPSPSQEPTITAMPDFNAYIGYADVAWAEYFFLDDSHSIEVTGDGTYTASFVASADAEDIMVLCIDTPFMPEDIPEGFQITATKLTVGDAVYLLGPCDYALHQDGTYRVSLRNPYDVSVSNTALGDTIIPVTAGQTISIQLTVEGTGKEATNIPTQSPSAKPSESPTPSQTPGTDLSPSASPSQTPADTQKPGSQGIDFSDDDDETSDSKSAPKKVKIKKVKSTGKKKIKVTWEWDVYTDGYQIQYATNKKFKKKRSKNASMYSSSKVIKKLKSKKKYFVRVRAYVVVNGEKKYGKWSKVKKVKVK